MEVVETVSVSCSTEQFESAVDILVRKPHSVNKKLAGSVMDQSSSTGCEVVVDGQGNVNYSEEWTLKRKLVVKGEDSVEDTVEWRRNDEGTVAVKFIVGQPLPEFLHCTFEIQMHKNSEITLMMNSEDMKNHPFQSNNAKKNFRSFVKWCSEEALTRTPPSLRLVDLEKYQRKYEDLKDKYGRDLVKGWTERTDPEKFVHEDLAIAAYLCLLWEGETVRFLDLGCGNGLLVHILSREGHPGTGLDLRARKVWDAFEPRPDLRVSAVVPSAETTFAGYDWLIGNHSDELTPWIPVMAALTSRETRFFVLPCCPFEFRHKFRRRNTGKPLYRDYLDHVKEV